MKNLKIYLRDQSKKMQEAWKKYFFHIPEVEISRGDIFAIQADAIVSPANSFGYMDGGIDLVYSEYFGWDLEKRLQNHLEQDYHGELPVGQAVIIPTEHSNIPYLISAPTMRVPMNISKTVNAYLAFRGALLAVRNFNKGEKKITSLLCPGLGTGVGMMPYLLCARQMHTAYEDSLGEFCEIRGGLIEAVRKHIYLIGE